MKMNLELFILSGICAVLSLSGSGCLSTGYHDEMQLAGDTVEIVASQPINVTDENSGRVHPLPQNTWICSVRENATTIEYSFYIDSSDLSGLDISMTLPDGTDVHAKDFKQTEKEDGGWVVAADHVGIKTITVVSEGESGYYSDDWDNDMLDMEARIGEGQRTEILLCGERLK